jgi:septum formation protein
MAAERPKELAPARLWLASGSPRRRALLEQLGIRLTVEAQDVDETVRPHETPAACVSRLASAKALAGAKRHPEDLVLAADTMVALEAQLLGKPRTESEALEMLERLSGRTHSVWTGVALAGTASASIAVESRVTFRVLGEAERRWYVRTGEPMDKAGGYGIQGLGAMLVSSVSGSYTNIVGLPLAETLALLANAGFVLPWNETSDA